MSDTVRYLRCYEETVASMPWKDVRYVSAYVQIRRGACQFWAECEGHDRHVFTARSCGRLRFLAGTKVVTGRDQSGCVPLYVEQRWPCTAACPLVHSPTRAAATAAVLPRPEHGPMDRFPQRNSSTGKCSYCSTRIL